MSKRQFVVTVKMPDGVTTGDMKSYIREAVADMRGCLSPDDPLFYLRSSDVTVKTAPADASPELLACLAEIVASELIVHATPALSDTETEMINRAKETIRKATNNRGTRR